MGWLVDGYDFKYRIKITVTEQSGNNLTNYAIRINLNSTNFNFSHFLNNGNDIRFTDDAGNLLDYWVELMDLNNKKAIIWVKVPSISANGTVTIYMYYGCQNAPSKSNISIFDHYQDFDNAVFLKISGVVDVQGGAEIVQIEPSVIRIDSTNGYPTWITSIDKFTEHTIEFRAKFHSGSNQNGGVGFGNINGTAPYVTFSLRNTGRNLWALCNYNDGQGDEYVDLGDQYLDDWHVFKIERKSDATRYYVDGTLVATLRGNITTKIPFMAMMWSTGAGFGGIVDIDWVKIYDANGNLIYYCDFEENDYYIYNDTEVTQTDSIISVASNPSDSWGKVTTVSKPFTLGKALRARVNFKDVVTTENVQCVTSAIFYNTDEDKNHTNISQDQDTYPNNLRYSCGNGSGVSFGSFDNQYTDWIRCEIKRLSDASKVVFVVENDLGELQEVKELTTNVPDQDLIVGLGHCHSSSFFDCDFIIVRKYVDPEPATTIGAEEISEETSVYVTDEDAYHGNYSCKFIVIANSNEDEKYIGIKQSQDLTGFSKIKFALKITEITGHCAFEVWVGDNKLAEYTTTTTDWEEKEVDVSNIDGTQEVKFIARAKNYAEDRKIVAYLDKVVKIS